MESFWSKADGLDVQVIQHAKEELVNAKANVLGVVLNQANLKRQQGAILLWRLCEVGSGKRFRIRERIQRHRRHR
jgi:hypothetical protein